MRARNIKPSIFRNELLAVGDPLYTLIYEGLWCLADREGRLEDRPARIHLEVNPGRAFDGTARALEWLADNGFVIRYGCGEGRFIQVVNFAKHQKPHQNEKPSEIPAHDLAPRSEVVPGIEQQTLHLGTKHLALNPSSLNPESLILNPESPFTVASAPDVRAGEALEGETESGNPETEPSSIGMPPGVNRGALRRWESWMLSVGKPVNAFSRPAIARQLALLGDLEAQAQAVERCISNGWRTLKPSDRHLPPSLHDPPRTRRKTADELEAEYRAQGKDPYAVN